MENINFTKQEDGQWMADFTSKGKCVVQVDNGTADELLLFRHMPDMEPSRYDRMDFEPRRRIFDLDVPAGMMIRIISKTPVVVARMALVQQSPSAGTPGADGHTPVLEIGTVSPSKPALPPRPSYPPMERTRAATRSTNLASAFPAARLEHRARRASQAHKVPKARPGPTVRTAHRERRERKDRREPQVRPEPKLPPSSSPSTGPPSPVRPISPTAPPPRSRAPTPPPLSCN